MVTLFKTLLFFLLLSFAKTLSAQNPAHFPTYKDILIYLIKTVKVDEGINDTPYHIAVGKTDTSYCACLWPNSDAKRHSVKRQCLVVWTPQQGYTKEIIFDPPQYSSVFELYSKHNSSSPSQHKKQRKSSSTTYQSTRVETYVPYYNRKGLNIIDVHRFYGYEGSTKAREDYYAQHGPSNTDDYYAMALMQRGTVIQYLIDHPAAKDTATVRDHTDTLLTLLQQSITAFAALKEVDPTHRTYNGTASRAYANERMYWFVYFYRLHLLEDAQRIIDGPPVYPDTVLVSAKQYLDRCPPQTILVIEDYLLWYCFLYAQIHDHYRTDITLIPFTLLDDEMYINQLIHPSKDSTLALTMALPFDQYKTYNQQMNQSAETIPSMGGHFMAWLNRTTQREVPFAYADSTSSRRYGHPDKGFIVLKELKQESMVLMGIVHANLEQRPILFAEAAPKHLLELELFPLRSFKEGLFQFSSTPLLKQKED